MVATDPGLHQNDAAFEFFAKGEQRASLSPRIPDFSGLRNDLGDRSAQSRTGNSRTGNSRTGGSSRAVFTPDFEQIYSQEPTPIPLQSRGCSPAALSAWKTPIFPAFPCSVMSFPCRTGRARALLLCSPRLGSSPAVPPRALPWQHPQLSLGRFLLPTGILLQTPRVSCSQLEKGRDSRFSGPPKPSSASREEEKEEDEMGCPPQPLQAPCPAQDRHHHPARAGMKILECKKGGFNLCTK